MRCFFATTEGRATISRKDIYGEIEKIIYPTGAYERFLYGQVPAVLPAMSGHYDQANRGVLDRWVSPNGDGTDELHWEYEGWQTTEPDGTTRQRFFVTDSPYNQQPYGFGNPYLGKSFEDKVYSTSNQLLRRKLTGYETTGPQTGGFSGAFRDTRPNKEVSIIFEPGASYALATMTETVYDTAGNSDPAYFSSTNAKQVKKYNYVVVNASTAASADVATAAAWFSSGDLATVTEMDYLYDSNYQARNINGLVTETRVKDASGNVRAKSQISYDETGYGLSSSGTMPTAAANSWLDPLTELGSTVGSNRGFPTTVKSYYDIANGYYIQTHTFYDQYGNVSEVEGWTRE